MEHNEQAYVVTWAAILQSRYPELELLYAIPNGAKLPYIGKGKRRFSPQARVLKQEGLLPGIPDLCLPIGKNGKNALYIEMKFGKNKPSPEQEDIIAKLRLYNNQVDICYSGEEAVNVIKKYLDIYDT